MKKLLLLLAGVVVTLFMASCGGSGQKENTTEENWTFDDGRTSEDMQRTITDTVAVLYNVHQFLRLQMEEKLDSALDMLYIASGDTVVPIGAERRAQLLATMTAFPVKKYQIDRLNMYTEDDTEVRYTIEYFEKEDDDPRQNTLQCVLAPRRVGYYWYLTVPDETRDRVEIDLPVED